jgi:hypothetical protein
MEIMSSRSIENGDQFADRIHSLLERNLIEAYLKGKGYKENDLKKMPEEAARRLRIEASIYASGKLAEIDIRAHFLKELKTLISMSSCDLQ